MNLKLLIPALILIILVIAGIAGFLILSKKTDTSFVLVRESGEVMYKTTEDGEYTSFSDVEITLESGTYIKTETDSYARVFLPDNSLITIDQSTEIQINVAESGVNIDQFLGKTWNRVQTVSKGGEYNVETPNTIAAVRGTIFGVDVENENSSVVYVEENSVEVNRYEEQDGDQKVLETVTLEVGDQSLTIRDEQSFRIEKGRIGDDFKKTFWYLRNKIIDEEYLKLRNEGRDGRRLIRLLQERLEQREDYKIYRFGLTPKDELSEDEIRDRLKDVFDMTKVTDDSCARYTRSEYQIAIDKINAYSEYITNDSEATDLLRTLSSYCDDGQFSITEQESLREKVDIVNNAN